MSILTRAAVCAAGAVLVLAGCSTGRNAVNQQAAGQYRFVAGSGEAALIPAAKRDRAPDIAGTLLDGRHFTLSSLRGDVVVLNFWGSWCAPCRAEAPELMAVYTATRARGVRFVGINVKDQRPLARAFDRTKGVTYPSIFDPEGRIALQFRNYPPNAIPSTIVLDRHHRVAAVFLRPLLRSDLLPVVQRLAGAAR
ncbi:MAG: TlpA family protein disulfide reductase [Mycobacteriales bacterium]